MTTLLCIGDVHLGRPVRRLPIGLERSGVGPEQLSPSAAWSAAVDLAVRRRVDAVLLAGDVADEKNRFYEALERLEDGARRLVDAGIPVLAVAGNHDAAVLPALAERLPGFTLLGGDGGWRTCTIERGGKTVARVIGWSFPGSVVTASPLDDYPAPEPGEGPLIGLVHGDLDVADSRYAPLSRAVLEATPNDAWLLGHIHVPSVDGLAGPRPIGYLGSLVGLDPTETGPRGPWLLHHRDGRLEMEHVPLAPLRWERMKLPVDDLAAPADLAAALYDGLATLHDRLKPGLGDARAVGVRVRLVGRAARPGAFEDELADIDLGSLARPLDDLVYFVDRVDSAATLAIDLEAMATGNDPAGLLARKLLLLDAAADDPGRIALLEDARRALKRTAAAGNWLPLGRAPRMEDDLVADELRRAGTRALETLLATHAEVTGEG